MAPTRPNGPSEASCHSLGPISSLHKWSPALFTVLRDSTPRRTCTAPSEACSSLGYHGWEFLAGNNSPSRQSPIFLVPKTLLAQVDYLKPTYHSHTMMDISDMEV